MPLGAAMHRLWRPFAITAVHNCLAASGKLLDVADKRRGQTSWSGSSVWNFSESLPVGAKNTTPPAGPALILDHPSS